MQSWFESFWTHLFEDTQIYQWETLIDDWFFVAAITFLGFELIRLLVKQKMNWNTIGDVGVNFLTLIAHIGIILITGGIYLGALYWVYLNASWTFLPNNWWTVTLAILLTDFAYYWEHRAAHRIGLGWATHTVHHSSPYFNISVAYRHGPLDAVFGLPFLMPIALLGFDPALILLSVTMVQLFQTALHTETIGKLPAFIEAIFNTPSHHRVHHGSNRRYIDKNYAGILIIWDRMFGSFEPEGEKVVYGVNPPINSLNPLVVFGHGFAKLARQMWNAKGVTAKLGYLIQPPGWQPAAVASSKQTKPMPEKN